MRFQYGNSSLQITQGVYRLRLRERDRYATGRVGGALLAMAGHPSIGYFRSRWARGLLGGLAGPVNRRIQRSVDIPGDYAEEIRGYAEGSGM